MTKLEIKELVEIISKVEANGVEWTLWSIAGNPRRYAADCGTSKNAAHGSGETAKSALESAFKKFKRTK